MQSCSIETEVNNNDPSFSRAAELSPSNISSAGVLGMYIVRILSIPILIFLIGTDTYGYSYTYSNMQFCVKKNKGFTGTRYTR